MGPISIVEMLYNHSLVFFVGKDENSQYSRKIITVWETTQVKGPISEIKCV